MRTDLILILGGARSGKSSYAEELAATLGEQVLYIATAEAGDAEMAARIAKHQQSRPAEWATLEAPLAVGAALAQLEPATAPEVLLLDCMTLLASNIVLQHENEPANVIEQLLLAEVEAIVQAQRRLQRPLIIVSNEVGLGVVPPYPLGRLYRDALGRTNRWLAGQAQQVLFMVAGLPLALKSPQGEDV